MVQDTNPHDMNTDVEATCEPHLILDCIADKWSLVILSALKREPLRHGMLRRECGTVSQKMLTQTLRRLERDGLITRTVHHIVPPKVEYARTPLGETLGELITEMCRWVGDHSHEVEAARQRYDTVSGRLPFEQTLPGVVPDK